MSGQTREVEGEAAEQVLAGGLGNEGLVVRVGDTVRRPTGPWTPGVHALLHHLEAVGFDGAPRVVAREGDVEILSFVPGVVAIPPYPDWSTSKDLLLSVADLQRRYHAAVAEFRPQPGAIWLDGPAPIEYSGALVCHNDLCLENVVVCDGHAVGFIDFDFARPVDRVWDIAIALRHWGPMWDAADLDESRVDLDRVARCATFLGAHRLTDAESERTIDALITFGDRALAFVRAQAEAGHTGHRRQWDAGYEGKNRRAQEWVIANRVALSSSARGLG